ncbi:MAG: hypothetical protein ACQETZ_00885 [Candidatus Fermentibacterota bacterium]
MVVAVLDDHELCWLYEYQYHVLEGPKSGDDKITLAQFWVDELWGVWDIDFGVDLLINDLDIAGEMLNGYSASSIDFLGDQDKIVIAGTRHHESPFPKLDDLLLAVAPGDCFESNPHPDFHFEDQLDLLVDDIGTAEYEGISPAYGNKGFAAGGVLENSPPYGYFVAGTRTVDMVPGSDVYVCFLEDSQLAEHTGFPAGGNQRLEAASVAGVGAAMLSLNLGCVHGGPVQLDIFDVSGRRVRSMSLDPSGESELQVRFDGRSDSGRLLPNGLYCCRAQWGSEAASADFVILR